jgi:hypothetical protein
MYASIKFIEKEAQLWEEVDDFTKNDAVPAR